MKDMTDKQALAEAIRRWGAGGTIRFRQTHSTKVPRLHRGRLARYCCTVSNGDVPRSFLVEGQGNTWREAFADADDVMARAACDRYSPRSEAPWTSLPSSATRTSLHLS